MYMYTVDTPHVHKIHKTYTTHVDVQHNAMHNRCQCFVHHLAGSGSNGSGSTSKLNGSETSKIIVF